MTIRVNTENNKIINKTFGTELNALLDNELRSFADHIKFLEVYLANEDGSNKSILTKRCFMEAQVAGRQPIVVTGLANSDQLAIKQAVNKLKTLLEAILELKTSFQPQRGTIATAYQR